MFKLMSRDTLKMLAAIVVARVVRKSNKGVLFMHDPRNGQIAGVR